MGGRGRFRRNRRGGGGSNNGTVGGGRQHNISLPMKRARGDGRSGPPARSNCSYVEPKNRHSEALEEYYRVQGIVPADEYPRLLGALATPLPSAFRIAASSRFRGDIVAKLTEEFPPLFDKARAVYEAEGEKAVSEGGANAESEAKAAVEDAGEAKSAIEATPEAKPVGTPKVLGAGCDEPLLPPTKLAWYPDGLGWSVSTPRMMMRRDSTLAPFQKWLVGMNELGAVNRQEAVSMVPPLLIDLKPGQSVLDLCAAPGSKTAQLLESLASSPPDDHALSGSGLIVANDVDIKRCWMLAHQLKRFGAPNLLVTNHDAQAFPSVTLFDRVLCDVPCTGDGTLRKSPDIWRKWTPQLGNGIHRMQKNILRRGIDLLKPGGRLVYSTCSMNPVENEAVVADALRQFGPDKLQLIDASEELPLLKRRPGLRTWKVRDTKWTEEDEKCLPSVIPGGGDGSNPAQSGKEAVHDANGSEATPLNAAKAASTGSPGDVTKANGWFEKFEEVPSRRTKVVATLFPPTEEELVSGNFPLERCLRLVPHDQDTGAFFVAVFIKPDAMVIGEEAGAAASKEVGMENEASEAKEGADAVGEAEDEIAAEADVGPDGQPDTVAEQRGDGPESTADDTAQKKMHSGPKQSQHSRLITDDPLVGVDRVSPSDILNIAEFFGLDEASCRACLMTRGSEAANYKKMLLVTPTVRKLLTMSVGSAEGKEGGVRGRLRVVNAGVRIFERTTRRDTTLPFRILSDALPILRTVMKERMITVEWDDLRLIMGHESTMMEKLSAVARDAFRGLSSGSVIVKAGSGIDEELVVAWKGQHAITKLMPKEELGAIRGRHNLPPEQKKPQKKPDEQNSTATGSEPLGPKEQ